MIPLRPYQQAVASDIDTAWQLGYRNVLAVLPTGAGKTVLFSHIIGNAGVPAIAIAHRHELVAQISLALGRNGIRHGLIAADSTVRGIVRLHMDEFGRSWYEPSAACKVASVDTLVRVPAGEPWLQRIGLWVCDEAHHAAIQGDKPNKWAGAALSMPNARGLGVTATPVRADGLGLGRHADGIFDWMVEGPTMRELIDAGFLTEYEVFCPPNDLDLSAVAVTASGDFSPEPLRKAVHSSHIVGDAVSHYLKHCAGKRGITFCVDIEAAIEQCQAYRAAGVPAEVISSKTDDLQRAAILRKFRAGEVLQLTNVDLVGEGFDLPALECVSMCRPTESFSLYAQQFGRVLRLMDGKRVGTVLDHVGNVVRHRGPPDMPRTWTLDRREKRGSSKSVSDSVPMRVCPECTRPYERSEPACPYCGHAIEPAGRSTPEQVEGDLALLDRSVFERMWQEVDRGPRFPHGASMATVGRIKRDWFKRNEAREELRDAMAAWGGVRRAAGDDDRRIQRRFFLTFGIDVVSAQALPSAEATKLTERVRELLQRV